MLNSPFLVNFVKFDFRISISGFSVALGNVISGSDIGAYVYIIMCSNVINFLTYHFQILFRRCPKSTITMVP